MKFLIKINIYSRKSLSNVAHTELIARLGEWLNKRNKEITDFNPKYQTLVFGSIDKIEYLRKIIKKKNHMFLKKKRSN